MPLGPDVKDECCFLVYSTGFRLSCRKLRSGAINIIQKYK